MCWTSMSYEQDTRLIMWFEPVQECFDAADPLTFVSLFDWVFMYNMYSKC